jgi:hypothetical protein
MKEDGQKFGYFDLFDDPNQYFILGGCNKMVLTKSAALAVCDMLTERGLFVIGTHAGYWRNPGYEERHEYGYFRYPEFYHLSVKENNDLAKLEIAEESDDLDVFLVSHIEKTD